MEIYSLRNMSFRYPDVPEDAVHDVSLTIAEGEFVTLCGLSGSGKSTLLRQLKTCLQPPGTRSGTVLWEGNPIEETAEADQIPKIGFVSQSPDRQSVTDKVWHELAFGLESLGLPNAVIRSRTAEAAAFFGIEAYYEKSVSELSGGQKQILNVASVMVMRPKVLILDEPTTRLDPIAREEFMTMLFKLNRESGTAILLCEHQLSEAFAMSDRILWMEKGRLIFDGKPEDFSRTLFENHSPLTASLPAPVRIFEQTETDIRSRPPLPVSTIQGRQWLLNRSESEPLRPVPLRRTNDREEPLITIQQIYHRYEKDQPDVLKGLSLTIRKGELLSVTGGNGSGKTTLLSLLTGLYKPYRGRIRYAGNNRPRISLLPQDFQALFVCETVEEELQEVLTDCREGEETLTRRLHRVISFCRLEGLLQRHPYDLSGGEQQRAALAKVLLTEPEVLLLDEPEKGLDSAFRKTLADLLRRLTKQGMTVVTVCHDMEFCAACADRCVMLFRGAAVSEGSPQEFFSGNHFYTTPIRRMTEGLAENAVTDNDLLYALSVREPEKPDPDSPDDTDWPKTVTASSPHRAGRKSKRFRLFQGLLAALFLFFLLVSAGTIPISFFSETPAVSYIGVFTCGIGWLLLSDRQCRSIHCARLSKRRGQTVLTVLILFLAVPLTVWLGIRLWDDTKYLFISLLMIAESLIPFYFLFEKRGVPARELVLTATLTALCVAGRALFYMLPEFKPVTALVIIFAVSLGEETGFLIGSAAMLLSNFFFGQGAWTPWQMFAMGMIGCLSGLLFHRGIIPINRISLSIFGFIAALVIYGGIMNPAALILSRSTVSMESLLTVYAFGLPLDTVHAVSTAVFLFIGAEPLLRKLERVKKSLSGGTAAKHRADVL